MALPERSIVPHLADGLLMEPNYYPLSFCISYGQDTVGIIKMWCPVKDALRSGRANATALSLERRKEKKKGRRKVLFFSSSICPVLSCCVKGPSWHLLSIPLKESFTRVNLPAKTTGGFWRQHVESCHRSSRNLFSKSHKSWPGAYKTTVLLKHKVIALNSLSAICIFNNLSSESCPAPTGIFASIHSWLLI